MADHLPLVKTVLRPSQLPPTAGKMLLREINSEKAWAGVDGFVTGHCSLQNIDSFFSLDIWFGSRQDAIMKKVFLQLR